MPGVLEEEPDDDDDGRQEDRGPIQQPADGDPLPLQTLLDCLNDTLHFDDDDYIELTSALSRLTEASVVISRDENDGSIHIECTAKQTATLKELTPAVARARDVDAPAGAIEDSCLPEADLVDICRSFLGFTVEDFINLCNALLQIDRGPVVIRRVPSVPAFMSYAVERGSSDFSREVSFSALEKMLNELKADHSQIARLAALFHGFPVEQPVLIGKGVERVLITARRVSAEESERLASLPQGKAESH